jgi:hypothetical protein
MGAKIETDSEQSLKVKKLTKEELRIARLKAFG